MNINCTVLLQIVHFWIAYTILRFLFFRPLLDLITTRKRQHKNILQAISDLEEHIGTAKRQRQKAWDLFHTFVDQKKPIVYYTASLVFAPPSQAPESPASTIQDQKHIVENLKTAIWNFLVKENS